MKLLSVESDAKTTKGSKNGYLTGILYLAPSTEADGVHNMCPMATPECIVDCLYSAGRSSIFPAIKAARVRKTLDYIKQGMDDVVETYRNKMTGKLELDRLGSATNNTLRTLIKRIDDVNPDYAKARAAYEGPAKMKTAMLKKGKFSGWTKCPECGGKVRAVLAGRKNHIHMACETPGCMRVME